VTAFAEKTDTNKIQWASAESLAMKNITLQSRYSGGFPKALASGGYMDGGWQVQGDNNPAKHGDEWLHLPKKNSQIKPK